MRNQHEYTHLIWHMNLMAIESFGHDASRDGVQPPSESCDQIGCRHNQFIAGLHPRVDRWRCSTEQVPVKPEMSE